MAQGQVVIKFKGSSGGSTTKSGINKNGNVKDAHSKLEKERVRLVSFATKKIIKGAQSILTDEIKYEINKYYDLTDNVQGQRNMNIAMNLTNKTIELGQAILSGTLVSGNIIGGIIAGTLDLVKQGVDIYQGYDKQNIKIRQMEEQLTYTRLRSGYSLTSGDKGENR